MGILVIGSGFWGTATALTAQQRGIECTILDANLPLAASPKAAGIINWQWFSRLENDKEFEWEHSAILTLIPHWWDRFNSWRIARTFIETFADYTEHSELLTSYTGKPARRRPCHLVSPWVLLQQVAPLTLLEHAERLERSPGHGWAVHCQSGAEYQAEAVVLTAGAWSDELLNRSGLRPAGVTPLPGRALVLQEPTPEVRTHFVNRFSQYTLRPWHPGSSRLGDSVERAPRSKARTTLYRMAELLHPGAPITGELYGWRPLTGKLHVERHAPGLVVATGGHRIGLAVSGAVADRTLNLLRAQD